MLHEQIKEEVKDALKAKDEVKLTTLRGLLTAFTNELVADKKKPDEKLSDEKALEVINREAKKRKDSIEQFEKGGRSDLADDEKKELEILSVYLPKQMSEEEVKKVVQAKKEELGTQDKSQMGMLMGAVMKELKGRADGSLVKKAVEEALS